MEALAVDKLVEKGEFRSHVAQAIAEAIDITIKAANFVTVPMLDARFAQSEAKMEARFSSIEKSLEAAKVWALRLYAGLVIALFTALAVDHHWIVSREDQLMAQVYARSDARFAEQEARSDASYRELRARSDASFKEMLARSDAMQTRSDTSFKEMQARSDAGFKEMQARSDASFKEMQARTDARFSEQQARSDHQFDQLRTLILSAPQKPHSAAHPSPPSTPAP